MGRGRERKKRAVVGDGRNEEGGGGGVGGGKSEGDRVDPRGKAGCHVHEKQHGVDVF